MIILEMSWDTKDPSPWVWSDQMAKMIGSPGGTHGQGFDISALTNHFDCWLIMSCSMGERHIHQRGFTLSRPSVWQKTGSSTQHYDHTHLSRILRDQKVVFEGWARFVSSPHLSEEKRADDLSGIQRAILWYRTLTPCFQASSKHSGSGYLWHKPTEKLDNCKYIPTTYRKPKPATQVIHLGKHLSDQNVPGEL